MKSIGHCDTIRECRVSGAHDLKVVLDFGVMPFDRKLSINTLPLHFGKVLSGSHGGESLPAEDIPRLVRMMQDQRFDPSGFVSHRIPLEQINDGIARMRSGEVIHCMVSFHN